MVCEGKREVAKGSQSHLWLKGSFCGHWGWKGSCISPTSMVARTKSRPHQYLCSILMLSVPRTSFGRTFGHLPLLENSSICPLLKEVVGFESGTTLHKILISSLVHVTLRHWVFVLFCPRSHFIWELWRNSVKFIDSDCHFGLVTLPISLALTLRLKSGPAVHLWGFSEPGAEDRDG